MFLYDSLKNDKRSFTLSLADLAINNKLNILINSYRTKNLFYFFFQLVINLICIHTAFGKVITSTEKSTIKNLSYLKVNKVVLNLLFFICKCGVRSYFFLKNYLHTTKYG